jgi:glucosamine kinase
MAQIGIIYGVRTFIPDLLYLGIDGGGTSCRARLTDAAGRLLGEGVAGSANVTLGIDIAAAAIVQAANLAFAAAGLGDAAKTVTHAGFGLAGANVPSLAAAVRAVAFPFAAITVASDAVAACLGAHGGGDGAILILGTGSQGLAIVAGRATAIGGWGFALSDDASGAILGRAAIRAAVAAVDGLAPPSTLTATLMARFGGQPAKAVEWAAGARPRDYGAFVPLVLEHAASGDPVAATLLAEAVAAAAGMLDRLLALGARRVALMGGLAEAYGAQLAARFAPVLVAPRGDAMDGALALARAGVAP